MSYQFDKRNTGAAVKSSLLDYIKNIDLSSALIGGAIGLVFGLIIGWVIWPVQWTNAWPSDLAPEARAQYLASVAQVYANDPANGANEAARAKLYDLNENLGEEIAAAQQYFNESLQRDARAQVNALALMADGLGVESADIIPLSEGGPAPAVEDAAAPTSSGGSSWLRWIFSFLLVVVLIGGGVWIISKLARRRSEDDSDVYNATPTRESAANVTTDSRRAGSASGGPYAMPSADDYQFDSEPDDEELFSSGSPLDSVGAFTESFDETDFDDAHDFAPPRRDDLDDFDAPDKPSTFSGPTASKSATVATSTSASAAVTSAHRSSKEAGRVLNTYLVQYHAGDVDYDQSHNIIDPANNQYIGECGMGVNVKNGILHNIAENVIALDVWLFDQKQDNSLANQSRVLLSEYAIDRGLEQSFIRQTPDAPTPVVAQPGISFQLKGQNLILDCEILEAEYTSAGSETGIFKNVKVEMTVRVRG